MVLLLSALALLARHVARGGLCFVAGRPRASPRARALTAARRASDEAREQKVTPTNYVLGVGFDSEDVDGLAAALAKTGAAGLWDMASFEPIPVTDANPKEIPKYKRWMDERQFGRLARNLRPQASDETVEILFMTLAQGNGGFIQKDIIEKYLESWGRDSFNSGAFQGTVLGAKANMAFAYWFLYVFAPFCTYFFFLRAPLLGFTGLDLLPGTPKFWERGAAAAGAAAAAAAGGGAPPGM